jgi:hypothetical protein
MNPRTLEALRPFLDPLCASVALPMNDRRAG